VVAWAWRGVVGEMALRALGMRAARATGAVRGVVPGGRHGGAVSFRWLSGGSSTGDAGEGPGGDNGKNISAKQMLEALSRAEGLSEEAMDQALLLLKEQMMREAGFEDEKKFDQAMKAAIADLPSQEDNEHQSALGLSSSEGQEHENKGSLGTAAAPRISISFRCTHQGDCEQKSEDDRFVSKTMSQKSYEEGVVLIRCPCEKLHLVADNLGWFGEEKNIEEIMKNKGHLVKRLRAADLLSIE